MQEMGEPCGMPFTTGIRSLRMPSRHTATCLSSKKEAVHWTLVSGIPFCGIILRRQGWFTKSKYPLMSKQSAEVTSLWSLAASTSCTNVSVASVVELPGHPPN
ncbi:hypothetical protein K439DRAFT_1336174 [Ramaria rubella]|nr:hypothetical protein K439DRAFT_1336174 [Ramaria rubella]